MYVALARTVWTDVDRDKVAKEVAKIRARYPGASNEELVSKLIRQTALRCAAIGAIASAPPGFLSIVPLAADFSYQVLALNRLVLTVARIYGRPTSREQRGATVAASLALGGGTEFVRRNLVIGVTRSLKRQRATHLVPVFGGLLGAIMSYASVRAVGRQAQAYYRPKRVSSRARAKR
jgi:uncharacterized protein (DUF697 family)